tara:strand:- start:1043 stop:1690 length:648 start_codon:yes stop_codon:yes gene_type:complete
MIEVLDNILTVEEQDELENLVKSETFREGNNVYWLNDSNDYNNKDGDYKPHNAIIYIPDENIGQFTGNLKNKAIEKYIKLIGRRVEERLDKRIKHFLRVKINKLSPLPEGEIDVKNDVHLDRDDQHHAMIYYINDSDGDTQFYKKDKKFNFETIKNIIQNKEYNKFIESSNVSPKKGRVTIFEGNIPHKGCYPTKTDRYIINFNILFKTKLKKLI